MGIAIRQNVYEKTLAFYEGKAPEYAGIWGDPDPHLFPYADRLASLMPPGTPGTVKLLVTGAGPGRDVKMFEQRGYRAYGIELSPKTVMLSKRDHPELRDRLLVGDIMDLRNLHGQFRVIFDNATLLHIKAADADTVIEQYRSTLLPEADLPCFLFLREKEGTGEQWIDTGEYPGESGRFFKLYQLDEMTALVRRHGFQIVESGRDRDRRDVPFVWLFARLI